MEYVKRKHIMSGFIRHMHKTAMGRLLDENGKPNKPVIEKLVSYCAVIFILRYSGTPVVFDHHFLVNCIC